MRIDDTQLLTRLTAAASVLEAASIASINAAARAAADATPAYLRRRIRRPSSSLTSPTAARTAPATPDAPLARVYAAEPALTVLQGREFGHPARLLNRPVADDARDARGRLLPQFRNTPANIRALQASGRYFVGRPRGAKYDFEGIFERRFISYRTMTVFEHQPARGPTLHLRRYWRQIASEGARKAIVAELAGVDL